MHPITIATLLLVAMATVAQGGNSHFFQYANVPAWNAYEFGYNRGNQHHFTSRFEKAHGWTFKTKVRVLEWFLERFFERFLGDFFERFLGDFFERFSPNN